eukprot:356330-Chlamydomonas_euryale.AAC.1
MLDSQALRGTRRRRKKWQQQPERKRPGRTAGVEGCRPAAVHTTPDRDYKGKLSRRTGMPGMPLRTASGFRSTTMWGHSRCGL